MNYTYYVYILTNRKHGTIYTGITNDIERRYFEHKTKLNESFTKKYNLNKLVYVEEYTDVYEAIGREKQLKNWKRKWKTELIEGVNPNWDDYFN
jgi:putative endonuclease